MDRAGEDAAHAGRVELAAGAEHDGAAFGARLVDDAARGARDACCDARGEVGKGGDEGVVAVAADGEGGEVAAEVPGLVEDEVVARAGARAGAVLGEVVGKGLHVWCGAVGFCVGGYVGEEVEVDWEALGVCAEGAPAARGGGGGGGVALEDAQRWHECLYAAHVARAYVKGGDGDALVGDCEPVGRVVGAVAGAAVPCGLDAADFVDEVERRALLVQRHGPCAAEPGRAEIAARPAVLSGRAHDALAEVCSRECRVDARWAHVDVRAVVKGVPVTVIPSPVGSGTCWELVEAVVQN